MAELRSMERAMDYRSSNTKKLKPNLEIVPSVVESAFTSFSHPWPWPQCVWHYHPEYEIHLILNSSGQVWVGDYIGPFHDGHLVLVGPDLPHNWTSNNVAPAERTMQWDHVIQFRDDSFGPEFFNVPDLAAVRDLLVKARRGIEFLVYDPTLVRQIVDIAERRGVERVVALLQILQKLVETTRVNILCSEGYSPVLGDNAAVRINQVISFMRTNLKEELTLEDAAKHVQMQPRSFSRFFRQIVGRRFSDYLCEMRVGEACDLLQNTDRTITDICFSVGFNNISWFNRCFMESKKVSPREYRRIGLGRYGPFGTFPHEDRRLDQ
jgi:AraC-like DNA-binding protein/mannose-6-phosphate isomerase-like protein (cupin superfamily)